MALTSTRAAWSPCSDHVLPDGSNFNDLIGQCATTAANHGALVSCVSNLTIQGQQAGLIANQEKSDIGRCAANK